MKPHPIDADYRTACAKLEFPPNAWDVITVFAQRAAAERMIGDARATIRRLAEDNLRLSDSKRPEDAALYQANADEIDRMRKLVDELQPLAFPTTYTHRGKGGKA